MLCLWLKWQDFWEQAGGVHQSVSIILMKILIFGFKKLFLGYWQIGYSAIKTWNKKTAFLQDHVKS